MKLLPFQVRGVRYIDHFKGRVGLFDQMGLGKTLQTLTWIKQNPKKRPVIIVCPACAKYMWQREAARLGLRAEICDGRKPPSNQLVKPKILILNYEIIAAWEAYIRRIRPKILVLDEVHFIKNKEALRTEAIQRLASGKPDGWEKGDPVQEIPYIIGLSGTPLTNRPIELWPFLNIIRPDIFPSYYSYGHRYCGPRKRRGRWEFKGAAKLPELHALLKRTCMIRRLKKDVLSDLPAKTRIIVPLEIENRREYSKATNDFRSWSLEVLGSKAKKRGFRKAEALVKMGYLKRLAAQLKMKAVEEWVDNFLISSEEKIVLFCVSKAIARSLHKRYKGQAVLLYGDTPAKERADAEHSFQTNDKIRIFIGSIRSAGTAITLTAASTLAFVEMEWTPGDHVQAEDRIHRIGQMKKTFIYYLIAANTIEDYLCELIEKKQKVLEAVLDGTGNNQDLDIFTQLEKRLRQRRAA